MAPSIVKIAPPRDRFASSANGQNGATTRSQGDIPPVFTLGPVNQVDVFEISLDSLQKHLSSGSFTSYEYVKHCLERIHQTDEYLEAVIETNPDALDIATKLDEERKQGKIRGPLHGVPVMVKDNMATYDKMETTCGSHALVGSKVPRDAFIVACLRKAGAIIMGHTNLSEFAALRCRKHSHGFSPRRGQVRNPYDLRHSPFCSSGGSAVAVATNMVPLAYGTETDTSIIGPALINGVVGIKPTPGLVSRSGVVPSSDSLDTIGPIARCVADAVAGLDAIVGPDDRDPLTTSPEVQRESSYAGYLSTKEALKGTRFGVPVNRVWELVPEDQKECALKLFKAMEEAGAEIIYTDYPCAEQRIGPEGDWDWELGNTDECEFTVVKTEAYNSLNKYLSELSNTDIRSVEDIVEYNKKHPQTEGGRPGQHPAFPNGQDLLEKIIAHKGAKDEKYYKALRHIRKETRDNGIDAALKYTTKDKQEVELDALLLCDRKLAGQQIAAQAGYPTINIPIGIDKDGIPISVTLQQKAWKEGLLIKLASAIEDLRNHLTGGRPLPRYKNYLAKRDLGDKS